jgi:hypothetical protein
MSYEDAASIWSQLPPCRIPHAPPALGPDDLKELNDERRVLLEQLSRDVEQRMKAQAAFISSASEDHVRAFFVLPFLKLLGWADGEIWVEVQVGKGRGWADVLVGEGLRTDEEGRFAGGVRLIVEAKSIGQPLDQTAARQAMNYAHSAGARYVAASDGLRWSLFDLKGNSEMEPVGWVYLLPVAKEALPDGVSAIGKGRFLAGRNVAKLLDILHR